MQYKTSSQQFSSKKVKTNNYLGFCFLKTETEKEMRNESEAAIRLEWTIDYKRECQHQQKWFRMNWEDLKTAQNDQRKWKLLLKH